MKFLFLNILFIIGVMCPAFAQNQGRSVPLAETLNRAERFYFIREVAKEYAGHKISASKFQELLERINRVKLTDFDYADLFGIKESHVLIGLIPRLESGSQLIALINMLNHDGTVVLTALDAVLASQINRPTLSATEMFTVIDLLLHKTFPPTPVMAIKPFTFVGSDPQIATYLAAHDIDFDAFTKKHANKNDLQANDRALYKMFRSDFIQILGRNQAKLSVLSQDTEFKSNLYKYIAQKMGMFYTVLKAQLAIASLSQANSRSIWSRIQMAFENENGLVMPKEMTLRSPETFESVDPERAAQVRDQIYCRNIFGH